MRASLGDAPHDALNMGATVSRCFVKLSVWLALSWPAAHAAAAAPTPLSISFAEQPARLVRDKSLYRAGRGVVLQSDDMLESGDGVLQVDAGGATIALGPASRIFVRSGGENQACFIPALGCAIRRPRTGSRPRLPPGKRPASPARA